MVFVPGSSNTGIDRAISGDTSLLPVIGVTVDGRPFTLRPNDRVPATTPTTVIVFPLLRPATASVTIFLGVWIWNDFIDPLIILGPSRGTTVTTGIYRSIGQYQADFGSVFALMVLATLPVLIFYLALQRHFVKGLTSGAGSG
jgi:raffinose/stachyose/melibiose transport system permease protein